MSKLINLLMTKEKVFSDRQDVTARVVVGILFGLGAVGLALAGGAEENMGLLGAAGGMLLLGMALITQAVRPVT